LAAPVAAMAIVAEVAADLVRRRSCA